MIIHDVGSGVLDRCQVCGSQHLSLVIDLGHQPMCDDLLDADRLAMLETAYPLRLWQCDDCTLAQLDYVIDGEQVYPPEYPYRAGISWTIVEAHRQMADDIMRRFGPSFCVDIGSNDGTLLKHLKQRGCEVLGFEPTDVADIAIQDGVPTVQSFFSEEAVTNEIGPHKKADVITLTNVFAHMATLGTVMEGITTLLDRDGVLIIENHYLLDILEQNQFDSIYHEHIRTYTLKSLMVLFSQYQMEVFDVERVPRYGGNIRVFVGWRGRHMVRPSVNELRAHEDEYNYPAAIARFQHNARHARYQFQRFLHQADGTVAGCSAPGRASTLLNYFGVQAEIDRLTWTGELHNSLKLGLYLPGCHIQVVQNTRLIEEQPDYIVLLAWHYAKEIRERLRKEGITSKLVCPLPYFKVYED